MASSRARRAAASMSSGMVTARGREPAAVDEQYRSATVACVLFRVARVTVAREQYRGYG
jgi:hypothetical protein